MPVSTRKAAAFIAMSLVQVVLLTIPGGAQVGNGRIAFDRDGRGGQKIWTMNPDGTFQLQLTKKGYNSSAAWTRDGTKIAFQSGDNPSHFEIFVMNANGTGLVQLTNNASESSFNPTWFDHADL